MTASNGARPERFDDALTREEPWYELTLFVNGASDLSARAIANARRLCDTHLAGRCQLSIVDLREDPDGPVRNRVLAAPTLVRDHPLPERRLVGDLSRMDKVLVALDLPANGAGPRAVR
jgi:circadian clock protein KaiB